MPVTVEYSDGSSERSSIPCDNWLDDNLPDSVGLTLQMGCSPVWNGMDRLFCSDLLFPDDHGHASPLFQDVHDCALFEVVVELQSDQELVAFVLEPKDGDYIPKAGSEAGRVRFGLFAATGMRVE